MLLQGPNYALDQNRQVTNTIFIFLKMFSDVILHPSYRNRNITVAKLAIFGRKRPIVNNSRLTRTMFGSHLAGMAMI